MYHVIMYHVMIYHVMMYHVIIIVDPTDGNTELLEESQVKSQRKQRKPSVKGFELFESLGIVMGVNIYGVTVTT